METKATIKNREGLQVVTLVDVAPDVQGLVFIAHGLQGRKGQAHIAAIAHTFIEKGYTAVRWDATHSTGESEGDMVDATATGYFHDFEDVVSWASAQPWYREPFVVVGHSLGGLCSILYTQKYPDKVIALAPLGTVVSGGLTEQRWREHSPKELAQWQKTGIRETPSVSLPGVMRRLKWHFFEDLRQYDVVQNTSTLRKHILLIVGSKDDKTPVVHQQIFFDAVPAISKEMHIVEGAPHDFIEPAHLAEWERIIASWIDTFSS